VLRPATKWAAKTPPPLGPIPFEGAVVKQEIGGIHGATILGRPVVAKDRRRDRQRTIGEDGPAIALTGAAGENQPVDGHAGSGDAQHAPVAAGIQHGRMGNQIAVRPVIGRKTTLQRKRHIDQGHLGAGQQLRGAAAFAGQLYGRTHWSEGDRFLHHRAIGAGQYSAVLEPGEAARRPRLLRPHKDEPLKGRRRNIQHRGGGRPAPQKKERRKQTAGQQRYRQQTRYAFPAKDPSHRTCSCVGC
jgi:hypothetical protein